MSKEELFEKAKDSILEIDEDMAAEVLEEAKAEGVTALELLQGGFSVGMNEIGEKYARGEAFIPELVFAADVMKIATDAVEEELEAAAEKAEKMGIIVLGTVDGDVHDIGKNLCVSMLKAKGFEVHDLGKEVPAKVFIEKAKEVNADIIASSALLTTTMPVQQDIEDLLDKEGLKEKIKTMVGGAPVTQEWADKIGASAYSGDALSCCDVALKLIRG